MYRATLLYIIAAVCSLLPLGGCSEPPTPEAMIAADRLSDSLPDSALSLLESIDAATLRSESLRARYTLLQAKAAHKAFRPLPSDSLLRQAIEYFDSHGPDSLTLQAHFYRAVGLTDFKGDLSDICSVISEKDKAALNDALIAREIGMNSKFIYWTARCNELISDIYYNTFHPSAAAEYSLKAKNGFLASGHRINAIYAIVTLANIYNANNETDKAIITLDTLKYFPEITTHVVKHWYLETYCLVYVNKNDYKKALEFHNKACADIPMEKCDFVDWAYIANIYLLDNRPDSTRHILDYIQKTCPLSNTYIQYIKTSYQYYDYLNKPDSALKYHKKFHDLVTTKVNSSLNWDLRKTEAEFIDNLRETQLRNSTIKIIFIITISIILVSALLLILYLQKRKNAKKHALEERQIAEARSIIDDLSIKVNSFQKYITRSDRQALHQRTIVETMLNTHFKELDILTSQYYTKKDTQNLRPLILKDIEIMVKGLSYPSGIIKLTNYVNLYCDNAITKLRKQIPDISDEEIAIYTYLCTGFSAKSISLFMNIQMSTLYKRIQRIKSKIRFSNASDKQLFLRLIGS